MLVSEIISIVRKQAADVDAALASDATIYGWINAAQRDIAAKTDALQAIATSNVTAGTSQYSMPVSILTLHSVKANGKKLRAVSMQEYDAMYDSLQPSAEPDVFYVWANTLNLYPTPDTTVTSGLKVYYTKTPTEVTAGTDTPELPVQFHNTIVDYCLAQYADLDDNAQKYQQKMSEVVDDIQQYKDMPAWEHDAYPFIQVSAEDGDFSG